MGRGLGSAALTSLDLQTFFDCHRRAFAHFGGVPMTIVYDRTKTVVRRHVAPGEAVPLHPEAVGFAGHYDFGIDVLAAYRPQGKGRVERQVLIVRDQVLSSRAFSSVEEMDAAFSAWVPRRRAQRHKTHREVIGHRAAQDHVALKPVPPTPYLVAEQHLGSYLRPSVLVIDEVGYQPLEHAEANLVFQVISKRYEKGSIILTSNKTFSEWGQVFGDEVLATAILDRLLHHCKVVAINGPSYLLKNRLQAIERETEVA
ncbi:ATP-binding protein [Streptomyces niveus]